MVGFLLATHTDSQPWTRVSPNITQTGMVPLALGPQGTVSPDRDFPQGLPGILWLMPRLFLSPPLPFYPQLQGTSVWGTPVWGKLAFVVLPARSLNTASRKLLPAAPLPPALTQAPCSQPLPAAPLLLSPVCSAVGSRALLCDTVYWPGTVKARDL